ncbi:hypothetical protein C2S51_036945 [Perilla frutescens var. frutescens]|nr:hypothetical protein C2S51_036945 [Perilla frutescens var. frutescens]
MNTKIVDQPHYSNSDLVFEISSSALSDRTRFVSFNKETHDISCTCRMWESKGVFFRHIFKVLYLMNVEIIPERYILRRWMRECKRRCIPDLSYVSRASVNDNLSGLLFVNNVMRLTYDLAYQLKGDGRSRSRMQKSMFELRQKLLKDYETRTLQSEKSPANGTPVWKMRNPSPVKSRGKCVRRTWRKSKLKGPKGEGAKMKDHSPVVDSIIIGLNFVESTWKADLTRECLMCGFKRCSRGDIENNKQILRLVRDEVNEELGVDIPFPSYLAKLEEWEERYHQFKWLISRPDVFYYPIDNTVEASLDVWTVISRIRPNLLVYKPKGEPCWEQMRVLFRETIILSETHSRTNARSGDPSNNECVSEVVDQPSASTRTYKSTNSPQQTESRSQWSSYSAHSRLRDGN